MAASRGFKVGAISGAISGGINGYVNFGSTRYFPENSDLAKKYPDGVKFTAQGGKDYPRFEKYAIKKLKFEYPTVEKAKRGLALSGYQVKDTLPANKLCGFKTTPKGYVWHHCEDMQTMILIPKDVHSMYHSGGASLIRHLLYS